MESFDIKKYIKEIPNDMELGLFVRSHNNLLCVENAIKKFSNDQTLGEYLRKEYGKNIDCSHSDVSDIGGGFYCHICKETIPYLDGNY